MREVGISTLVRGSYVRFRAAAFVPVLGIVLLHAVPARAYCTGSADAATYPTYSMQVTNYGTQTTQTVVQDVVDTFTDFRDWLSNDFARQTVWPALRSFAAQMSAVGMHQTFIIGTFLDAKHQLETQRLFQELQVQAHKDYQPSESFCTFGTAVRSLAHTESIGRYNALALSKRQMARHLGQQNIAGAKDAAEDKKARWRRFTEIYCDPQDNSWTAASPNTSGLARVCVNGGANNDRVNIDIDYTRLIENRRTLDVSYPNYVNGPDEQDVIALGNNLYGNDVLYREIGPSELSSPKYNHRYMKLRSVAAKRSVAENSYNAIVGLKSLGTTTNATGSMQTYRYLGAILTNLGIPANEVKQYLGLDPNSPRSGGPIPDPSYFAQLEILAKKIYQSPSFYSNLYDSPANIKRKSAALKAIELMLDRAIYESQLRQEMAMSVLLSSKLEKEFSAGAGGE